MTVLSTDTQKILERFEALCQIPRPSRHEGKVIEWLENWAKAHQFSVRRDPVGNLAIQTPASPGCESAPRLVIQAHMDMVCEKTPESTHDFSNEAIRTRLDGEWLSAEGTTLGADNGIGLVMGMLIAESDAIARPPLELLLTVDEETGLTGATALEGDFIEGRRLINLDSEEEGVLIVGCAGGVTSSLHVETLIEPIMSGYRPLQIQVGGLRGGHSGIEIHQPRVNAIKLLTRILDDLLRRIEFRMESVQGGSAHNAIPRDAGAVIWAIDLQASEREAALKEIEESIRAELAEIEPGFQLTISPRTPVSPEAAILSPNGTRRALELLGAVPHGVIQAWVGEKQGIVETSINLAQVKIEQERLKIVTSQRSFDMEKLEELTRRVETIVRDRGGETQRGQGYPSWKPNWDSELLERTREIYLNCFGDAPRVEVIHAGLECGIIGERFEGMDMISFGPTILGAHSPDERVHVGSIERTWTLLKGLVESLSRD